jgi:hypothetical protein
MEDEKQLRILNQLFIPLSQAMPALVQAGDQEAVRRATMAMAYIVGKQIEISGANSAHDLQKLWAEGDENYVRSRQEEMALIEGKITETRTRYEEDQQVQAQAIGQLQEMMQIMATNQQTLMEKLGVGSQPSENGNAQAPEGVNSQNGQPVPTV